MPAVFQRRSLLAAIRVRSRCSTLRTYALVALTGLVGAVEVQAERKKKTYSMADLEALAASQSWLELLQHIGDIRPAQRKDRWRALLKRSAKAWLADPAVAADPRSASAIVESLLRLYPGLKSDKALMAQRAKVGLEAFRRCFAERYWGKWCEERFRAFVKQDLSDAGLAFEAGKLARLSMHHHMAVPYFYLALVARAKRGPAAKQVGTRCKDPDVSMAVTSALALPAGKATQSKIKQAQTLAFSTCWPAVREKLLEAVSGSSYMQRNACAGLLAKNALSGIRRIKCKRVVSGAGK